MLSESPIKTVLIHFSGRGTPGLTAEFTGILARTHVSILDNGQAVVHENLVLGMFASSGFACPPFERMPRGESNREPGSAEKRLPLLPGSFNTCVGHVDLMQNDRW